MNKILIVGAILSMAFASSAGAQSMQIDPQNMGASMAQVHGGMEELARHCGLHTPADLAAMKTKNQQMLATQNQLPASHFERFQAQGACYRDNGTKRPTRYTDEGCLFRASLGRLLAHPTPKHYVGGHAPKTPGV